MPLVARALAGAPVSDLEHALQLGFGDALAAARGAGADVVLATVIDSGLRGRGGAGFPTGEKWRTVLSHERSDRPLTVVVNAAEGEPGTFKDRAILAADPFRVLEGALIAALVVGAGRVVVATKAAYGDTLARVRAAVEEVAASDLAPGVEISVLDGPSSYLYGEETGLLEVLEGRAPLPRVQAPYLSGSDVGQPTLVDNVETLANIPAIVLRGSEWFRSIGTAGSPGTICATVSGRVHRPGVYEVAMGTPLRELIEQHAGGVVGGHIACVLNGVSSAPVPPALLDTPLTYEDLQAAGTALGSASFIVLDETVDLVAAAAGVSRFLAVESCGQCTPCKAEGLSLMVELERMRDGRPDADDLQRLGDHVTRVADRARCALAGQHQVVIGRLLQLYPAPFAHRAAEPQEAATPFPVATIVGFDGPSTLLDEAQQAKQPDWTWDATDSGRWPAARLGDPAAVRAEADPADPIGGSLPPA